MRHLFVHVRMLRQQGSLLYLPKDKRHPLRTHKLARKTLDMGLVRNVFQPYVRHPICLLASGIIATSGNCVCWERMPIELRGVFAGPLEDLTISAPAGAIIGVIGTRNAG